MIWMEQYTDKRLRELQQDVIRNRWHTIELEKAVEYINDMQQDKTFSFQMYLIIFHLSICSLSAILTLYN